MTRNVGTLDRILRIVVGIALIAFAIAEPDVGWSWIGWIVVLILTALIGWCPAYRLLGMRPFARLNTFGPKCLGDAGTAVNPDLILKHARPVPRYTSYPSAPNFSNAVGPETEILARGLAGRERACPALRPHSILPGAVLVLRLYH